MLIIEKFSITQNFFWITEKNVNFRLMSQNRLIFITKWNYPWKFLKIDQDTQISIKDLSCEEDRIESRKTFGHYLKGWLTFPSLFIYASSRPIRKTENPKKFCCFELSVNVFSFALDCFFLLLYLPARHNFLMMDKKNYPRITIYFLYLF